MKQLFLLLFLGTSLNFASQARPKTPPPTAPEAPAKEVKEAKEEKAQQETEITQAELAVYEKELLAKYKPTDWLCGPFVTARKGRPEEGKAGSLDGDNAEAIAACLISGKRTVIFTNAKILKQITEKPLLQNLLQAKEIQMRFAPNSSSNMLLFTQRGKENAQLLMHGYFNPQAPHAAHTWYFLGHHLGYADEDIRAFYHEQFTDRLKEAHAWIAHQEQQTKAPDALLTAYRKLDPSAADNAGAGVVELMITGKSDKELEASFLERFESDRKETTEWVKKILTMKRELEQQAATQTRC